MSEAGTPQAGGRPFGAEDDWDTIDEHRLQHNADHAAIVAPSFSGGRLPDRAERHGAVLLTAPDLAELLRKWLQDKANGEPVLALPERTARMIHHDLRSARAAWISGRT